MAVRRARDVLDPIPEASDPEVGRWLAALNDVRVGTLRVLDQISPDMVDRDPADGGDTLGTVLYHVALVEIDWVYTDVLDQESDIPRQLFPFDDRQGDRLTPVVGESLSSHLARLERTRQMIVRVLAPMSGEEFHRVRTRDSSDVAADWVVYHLIDHELEHRARIIGLRDAFAG
jgi:uncharacterized damage-inducible protein DinB